MSKTETILPLFWISLSYFKPFTSNVFLRNNEAYKLFYTLLLLLLLKQYLMRNAPLTQVIFREVVIPWKKDNLSVYKIRKVYFTSLLSVSVFLKNKEHFQQRRPDQVEERIRWCMKIRTPRHASVSQSLSGTEIKLPQLPE